MWEKWELVWMSFNAKNENIRFSEIFAIVNSIVIFKVSVLAQIKSYKINLFSECLFHKDTAKNKW